MKEQKTTRFLEVQLSPEEIRERKVDLGTLCTELTGWEKKETLAKKSVKALEERRRVMASVVDTGVELQSVNCTVRQRGTRLQTYRDDTGELIEDRPATAEERQETLPIAEPECADDDCDECEHADGCGFANPELGPESAPPQRKSRKPKNTAHQGPARKGKRGK